MSIASLQIRQRRMVQALWHAGRLSRRELHQRLNVRPNTIGVDAAALLRAGIVRECKTEGTARGRPRVPLEIDPVRRNVVGLAIRPGIIEAIRLNLQGHVSGDLLTLPTSAPSDIVAVVRDLLADVVDKRSLAVGIATPGFVDPDQQTLLYSSATPIAGAISLQPALVSAGRLPVVLENDMHALAARWLLTRQAAAREDVLLVYFEDDALGGALLIDGRPNRGCVTGANELGHTRLPVMTDRCFCGQVGCLERIVSSAFLRRLSPASPSLAERCAAFDASDVGIATIIEHLSTGLANAANFTRVNRLILISSLTRHAPFADALTTAVRRKLLQELAGRVRIEHWDQPSTNMAENAGWLALASLYVEGWV